MSVLAGAPILLVVFATGAYSFQWKKDGEDIPGANNNSYLIPVTVEGDSGGYTVEIGGIDGTCSTLSAEAEVMVSSPDDPCAHFEITTDSDLGSAYINNEVSIPLAAVGGVSPYTWTITSGALPTGLSLGEDGVITGTTSDTLTAYTFTAQATDAEDECQGTKEFTLELADACALENIPEVLDATELRDWIIAWTGDPLIFSGPPHFTWDGMIPIISAPGVHPILYKAEFIPLSPNPNYAVGVDETTSYVNKPCFFRLSFGVGCFANFSKLTPGPLGVYTVSVRSPACNGNQPPSETVTIN